MKKFFALLLTLAMALSLAACGDKPAEDASADTPEDAPAEEESIVYAVEAGSAGADVAADKGWEVNSVPSQADALMEVQSGASPAAIIDSLMAMAMTGEGTSYPDLVVNEEKLTEELYGVGCRKDSDLTGVVNQVLQESYADGSLQKIAEQYKLADMLVEQDAPQEAKLAETDSDVQYIKDKGTLIVGTTEFEPMDYRDADGNWIGFDADVAKLVAEKLGVKIEFLVIDWDRQLEELNSKNVDLLWNGMTLTDARLESMNCSVPYCDNAQVIVSK